MATPINAPMAGEIWHLSIEDLFQPVQEAQRLGGDGPFVINLSASTAPISLPSKAFNSQPSAHVYQIQVTEDGRTRYRLRLGPFATEDLADAVLTEVRETYPGALTATATGSDLRVIESMQAKAEQRQPAAQKPAQKPIPQKTAARETADNAPLAAEISIDIAWPTPELAVPPKAPPRNATPAAPSASPKTVSAPAVAAPSIAPAMPTAAVAPPRAAVAPAVTAVAPAVTAVAPAVAVVAAAEWTLPELDVKLPPAPPRAVTAARPVAKQTAAPPPELSASNFTAPLAIVNDTPLLTEVVMPVRKTGAKRKPAAVQAPILNDAIAPKSKKLAPPPAAVAPAPIAATSIRAVAPKIAAPVAATIIPPVAPKTAAPTPPPAVHAPIAVAPKTAAPAAIAPPISRPKMIAGQPATPKVTAPAPSAKAPVSVPAAPTLSAAPKSAAMPLRAAAQVPTQTVAPRNAAGFKARGGITKPLAANKLTSLQHVVVASAPAPAPREVKKLEEPLESLEFTQTVRALTPKELEDNDSRWFVIQLSLADQAFDPDSVPNLDIFGEYRLYSVAGLDQGRVVHALRLGFFSEEIAAVAVASYLAAYWDKPTIKRVSVAERERFADQRVDARKDVGATGTHAIIEITDELVARRRKPTNAAAADLGLQRPIEH